MHHVRVRLGDADVAARAAAAVIEQVPGGVVLTGDAVEIDAPGTPRRFYRHGWQSWSPTRWLDVDEPVAPVTVPHQPRFEDHPLPAAADPHRGAPEGEAAPPPPG